ncbi:MAG: hypothetical protein ACREV6_05635 [Clostridium sp.]
MKNLKNLNKKRIDIDELQEYLNISHYMDLVSVVVKGRRINIKGKHI